MVPLELEVAEDGYRLDVAEASTSWTADEYVAVRNTDLPAYEGPTEFEPCAEAQVVRVAGMAMASDLTIQPIPSNYGLVTWDGSVLMVS